MLLCFDKHILLWLIGTVTKSLQKFILTFKMSYH